MQPQNNHLKWLTYLPFSNFGIYTIFTCIIVSTLIFRCRNTVFITQVASNYFTIRTGSPRSSYLGIWDHYHQKTTTTSDIYTHTFFFVAPIVFMFCESLVLLEYKSLGGKGNNCISKYDKLKSRKN